MYDLLLPSVFFFIAFFYSLVGFGGGSSYLAILSLVLVDFFEIRSVALMMNLIVVGISTMVYLKNKIFKKKLFLPFIIFSVPVAFIGAQLRMSEKAFFLVLGGALMLSAIALGLQVISKKNQPNKLFSWEERGILGASIGFLSGVAGIGGGIFLSPILNLSGWANPRIVASLASTFILFNSASGLAGLMISDTFRLDIQLVIPLSVAVIFGGFLGSYFSNNKINFRVIKGLTGVLVAYVGLKLILLHAFNISI